MTIHISTSINGEKIHSTDGGVDEFFDIVACPDCSTTAAMKWADQVESTDGPVGLVRVTCVNRHWFLMPADALRPGL